MDCSAKFEEEEKDSWVGDDNDLGQEEVDEEEMVLPLNKRMRSEAEPPNEQQSVSLLDGTNNFEEEEQQSVSLLDGSTNFEEEEQQSGTGGGGGGEGGEEESQS